MSARDVSLTGIPNIGKATLIGALIGALSVALPVAALLLYIGGGPMSILAGAHVGFFGGMGYGGMLEAVIQSDRFDQRTDRTHKAANVSDEGQSRATSAA